MRLWILFGCGVLVVAAAIFPFTRRTEQLAPAPVTPAVAAQPTPSAPPTPEPAKIVEVIDLARAYEPVREPEEPAGAVNPASFIPEPETPRPIPPAIDLDNPYSDILRTVEETGTRPLMLNGKAVDRIDIIPRAISSGTAPMERLDVMPREVMPPELLDIERIRRKGEFRRRAQQRAEETGEGNYLMLLGLVPTETLDTMPRLLPARFVIEQADGRLLHYLETENDAVVRVPRGHSPAADHLTQPIPRKAFTVPLIPVEYLTVAPRWNKEIVGQIGP